MKRSRRNASTVSPATLCDVEPGDAACIAHLTDDLDPVLRRRLGALGFREGEQVTCLRRAPLGCPILFRVCGAEVCLRKEQARAVQLGLEPAASLPAAS